MLYSMCNKVKMGVGALACIAALGLSGCGTGAQVGGAVDRGLDMEDYTREESSQPQESTSPQESGGEITDINNTSVENAAAGELNEFGLDLETMDIVKYNIYVELNNTIVEIMDNINNYFLVVDTTEEFRFRDDAEYSYGYRIKGFNLDAVEDAELVYGVEPAYERLDELVEAMLPSMREIMETFDAIDDSEYTYEQNQYQQPKENHARLMACLETFTTYAYEYMEQIDVIADERLDELVEAMLPSMREIMETFDAIDDSEYTYEQNQYQQPKENHARLMACLETFTTYAYEYMEQIDVIADERSAAQEARMLEEGQLIIYNFSHMLTLSSQILDEIYDQGIDDFNLTELDLTPIYPLFEEMQATAAAYDEAVSDSNQLMKESLSNRQVYAGNWNGLIQAFEWMIKQVESGVPYEDPSHEYLGGLQHIYVVLSDRVEDYNGIFVE